MPLTSNSTELSTTEHYLNWRNRPAELQDVILSAWQDLARTSKSDWSYNGPGPFGYQLCGVDDVKLIKKIVQQNPDRRDFFVMDIGAGNFGWSNIVSLLNDDSEMPKNIRIHVFGVRGEAYKDSLPFQNGICVEYNLGSFQIENIVSEFERIAHSLPLERHEDHANPYQIFDMMVCKWTFRHLADPLGTFLQVYSMLRPGTGYLLMDGFFFINDTHDERQEQWSTNLNMHWLLMQTKAPFLVCANNDGGGSNQFVLQKPDHKECLIPLNYTGVHCYDRYGGERYQNKALTITRFAQTITTEHDAGLHDKKYWNACEYELSGNQQLYLDLVSCLHVTQYYCDDGARFTSVYPYRGGFLNEKAVTLSEEQRDQPIDATARQSDLSLLEAVVAVEVSTEPQLDPVTYVSARFFPGNNDAAMIERTPDLSAPSSCLTSS